MNWSSEGAPSPTSKPSPHDANCLVDGSGWMLSGAVAKRLGVKTSTLKKWRSTGKGPSAWRRVSKTVVVYLVSGVSEFERTWGAQLDGTEN